MTAALCISGPKDGERIEVSGNHFTCVEAPKYEYGVSTMPQFIIHTYRLLQVGPIKLFVHQDMSDDKAIERLVQKYRKPNRTGANRKRR